MQTEKKIPLFPKRTLPRFIPISLQRCFFLVSLLLGLMIFEGIPVEAADSCRNGSAAVCLENRPVDNVIDAFENLTHHGEWLGFRPGTDSPIRFIGAEKAHMQGIARSQRTGTPYLFISSAGNKYGEGDVGFDYSDANLMVIEMGSRDPTGERLRSNRLLRDEETECTLPPSADIVVQNITFPDYNHPGTLAIVGDILAIPFEQPAKPFPDGDYDCDPNVMNSYCNEYLPEGKISFYNVSDPLMPELIFDLVPVANVYDRETPTRLAQNPVPGEVLMTKKGFGIIGLTRLPDDYFLLVTGAGVGSKLEFWRSNKTSFFNDGDEQSEPFAFKWHSNVYKRHVDANGIPIPDSQETGMEDWFVAGGGAFHTYQNYSFVNQIDGSLFMIVGRNVFAGAPIDPGEDRIALYEITGFEDGGQIVLTNKKTEEQGVVDFSNDVSALIPPCTGSNPGDYNNPIKSSNANLIAGSNTYVSPTGELLFYAVEHYNWGPTADEATDQRTVRMAELRHQKVVREDSPTYRPSADAGIDYYVDEGSTITLNGTGSRPASAAPWAQLFEYKDFAGQSVMFDYADRGKDDYDNFAKLDGKNPIDELCFDAEKLDEVRVPVMKMIEEWKQFGSTDFMVDTCIGLFVINGECFMSPPITDPILNELCHTPCRAIIKDSERHDCHMACDNGIRGPVVSFPDIRGAAWNFAVATFNSRSAFGTAVSEVVDLAKSVKNCGDLEHYIPSTPPPLPEITLFTDISSEIDLNKDIVEVYAELLTSFPDFVSSLKTQFNVLTSYPYQLITYIDDFAESMKGFNNRASSVRWYAPSGLNITLYQKANYGGGYLTLQGTGSVEEIANLNYEQLSSGGNANNSIRSVQFDAEFSSPSIESYSWSIESPFPADPYMLHYALTSTPIFDATGGDGPLTAEIWLEVLDSAGESAQAQVKVNIANVPPVVEIEGIRDEIGGTTYTQAPDFPLVGMPVLLEALEYDLFGSFTDAGVLDTHISSIEWGDGRSNSSDENSFLLTGALNGETGTVKVPHVYASKGIYSIVLTVEDDDGGTGQTTLTVQVVDASGALELQIEALASIIYDAGSSDKHLLKALEKLQGNNEGAAQNGSLDKFQNAKPKPALEKIYQAKKEIEIAEKLDPNLDLTAIKEGLTLILMSSNAAELLASEAE